MTSTETIQVTEFIQWLEARGFTQLEAVAFYDELEANDGESAGEQPIASVTHDETKYTAMFVMNATGNADIKIMFD